jgi:hypothetical protein
MNNLIKINILAVIPAKAGIFAKFLHTLSFFEECSKEKLSSQNGNSKILRKNKTDTLIRFPPSQE